MMEQSQETTSQARTPAADLYAITVDCELRAGARESFLALVRENATASLREERACLRFDVLVPIGDDPKSVVLYEIYRDRAAFEHHLITKHFLEFDEATRPMIMKKVVVEFTLREILV